MARAKPTFKEHPNNVWGWSSKALNKKEKKKKSARPQGSMFTRNISGERQKEITPLLAQYSVFLP